MIRPSASTLFTAKNVNLLDIYPIIQLVAKLYMVRDNAMRVKPNDIMPPDG